MGAVAVAVVVAVTWVVTGHGWYVVQCADGVMFASVRGVGPSLWCCWSNVMDGCVYSSSGGMNGSREIKNHRSPTYQNSTPIASTTLKRVSVSSTNVSCI